MKSVFVLLIVAVIGIMVPTVFAATDDYSSQVFPPHFHDELTVSINSEDPIMISLQDSEKTNIMSHVDRKSVV